jgi:hypothetical protein
MGIFKKKGGKSVEVQERVARIPELPRLPEFPEMEGEDFDDSIHKLPRFPNGSLGEKFSQDTIKDAITGKKEGEVFADDFMTEDEIRMTQPPLRKPLTREVHNYPSYETNITNIETDKLKRALNSSAIEREEPIFVRMDRFEEGLKALDKTKKQILEIERLIQDNREIKLAEEKELESWEKQIQSAKEQLEKVDKSIFSKVE